MDTKLKKLLDNLTIDDIIEALDEKKLSSNEAKALIKLITNTKISDATKSSNASSSSGCLY